MKKSHKCDDNCKINHTVPKKTVKKPVKIIEKENVKPIKKKVPVVIKKEKIPSPLIKEIESYVNNIDNELETNKILEKTLINLRKLEKDIAN